jgi:hypothetical protein
MSRQKARRRTNQSQSQQSHPNSSENPPLLPLEGNTSTNPAEPRSDSDQPEGVAELSLLLDHVAKTARSIVDCLRRNDLVGAPLLEGLPRLREQMEKLLAFRLLENVQAACSSKREAALSNISSEFQRACQVHGLDVRGGFPDFIVNGTVYVGIDQKRLRAHVDDEEFDVFPVDRLAAQVSQAASEYLKKSFDPQAFLKELWRAHQGFLRSETSNADQGAGRVPVFELLPALAFAKQSKGFQRNPAKELFRTYSQHAFRADLYRFLTSLPDGTVNGKRLIIEPTSVAEQGLFMFIPTVGRCAFVGHIRFVVAE